MILLHKKYFCLGTFIDVFTFLLFSFLYGGSPFGRYLACRICTYTVVRHSESYNINVIFLGIYWEDYESGYFFGLSPQMHAGRAHTHTPHACAHTRGLPHLICAPFYRSFTIKRFVICNDYLEVKGTVFMNVTQNIYPYLYKTP